MGNRIPTRVQFPVDGWRPTWYQASFLDSVLVRGKKRFYALIHRQGGKDEAALQLVAASALTHNGLYLHLLPEYSQARRAMWDATTSSGKRRAFSAIPQQLVRRAREREMSLELVNGSQILYGGSDRYDSYRGLSNVRGIVFSEWAHADPGAWTALQPILTRSGGWAVFVTTPSGHNHAYRLWQEANADKKTWGTIRVDATESGVLSAEQLESARRGLYAVYGEDGGEAAYQQEYLLSFDGAFVGTYFAGELRRAREEARIGHYPADDGPLYAAWDIGVDDAMAIVLFQRNAGNIYVVDYLEKRHSSILECMRLLRERRGSITCHYVPHDARVREAFDGKTRLEKMLATARQFDERVLPVRVYPHAEYFEQIRTIFPRVYFNENTTGRLLDALAAHRQDYSEKRDAFSLTPKHDWTSHPVDAFKYMAMAIKEERTKPQPVDFHYTDAPIYGIGTTTYIKPSQIDERRRTR